MTSTSSLHWKELVDGEAHVDRLTQSLLSKAFRGELVPTEHALAIAEGSEYESASDLLNRILSTNGTISRRALAPGCQLGRKRQTGR